MTTQPHQGFLRDRSVGEIAAAMPGATAVFRKFNVDFCCQGDVVLTEAARQRGIDAADLEAALIALDASDLTAPKSRETEELIDHILARYHETHRRELPELLELAGKVEAVHANHPQVPRGLADTLLQMLGELEVHMKKEELILFPAMRQSAQVGLEAPIGQMRHDHDDHGELIRRLESLTDSFTLPEGACRSWQALYTGTAKLANDLMEHIHLENNVLFPRYEVGSGS
jgi:regulator of cell morphogenesis and NO signaling